MVQGTETSRSVYNIILYYIYVHLLVQVINIKQYKCKVCT